MLAGFVFSAKWCAGKQQLAEYNPVMLRLVHQRQPFECDLIKTSTVHH